jgi:hypothetical protein
MDGVHGSPHEHVPLAPVHAIADERLTLAVDLEPHSRGVPRDELRRVGRGRGEQSGAGREDDGWDDAPNGHRH